MSELREQYARETGKSELHRHTCPDYVPSLDYVAWLERRDATAVAILQGALDRWADLQRKVDELERRAACAEQLAAKWEAEVNLADSYNGPDPSRGATERLRKCVAELKAALAAHEAACKGKEQS